ncbi:MAG: IS256 family transposase [Gemmatimonadaceae bacterium]
MAKKAERKGSLTQGTRSALPATTPRKKKAPAPELDLEPLEALLGKHPTHEQFEDVFKQLKKGFIERILAAELTDHLGYKRGEEKPETQRNHRNGSSAKTIKTEDHEITLDIPRDRQSSFEPKFVPKGLRRFKGFDDKVLGLYARGVSVREIRGFLEDHYQVPISPDLISEITDEVLDEVTQWQQRPLEALYPVVIFDALRVKIRDEGVVRNKAVYLALGITREGNKEVLGFWIQQTEGAAFWLRVMSELKSRGVEDILIAMIDGLRGFPDAINNVFPETQIHHCVVHLVRQSLNYVSWQDRKKVALELKAIYRAPTLAAAESALALFEKGPWSKRFPPIAQLWRRHWDHVKPIFQYPPQIRRLVYTTNAIESLHMQLRKIIKTRGHFPTDEAAGKLIYLALRNIVKKWKNSSSLWRATVTHFALLFGDRFNLEEA